ncbi:uncharacterized protein N7484_002052 [Penicillium longicatenatum]|uniref:uncharacterized protein n=1 Tax=Penicillium longicatenatum TaxID=1561947 RepID=UPI0025489DD2|nr:uncharacterized protein N7484_002052 [Penicillium longicatenatum]KAJ5658403.1 hypothetical protein N7484_002052 [Penicillium longicatenatum]
MTDRYHNAPYPHHPGKRSGPMADEFRGHSPPPPAAPGARTFLVRDARPFREDFDPERESQC